MKKIKLVRNAEFRDPDVIAWINGDMPSAIFADYLEEKGSI